MLFIHSFIQTTSHDVIACLCALGSGRPLHACPRTDHLFCAHVLQTFSALRGMQWHPAHSAGCGCIIIA